MTNNLQARFINVNSFSMTLCFLSLLLFVCFSALAQQESNSASQPNEVKLVPAPDYFEQQQKDIKHYLTKVSEVLVGTQSYALLAQKSNTPINKGVVILLPDWHDFISPSQHLAYLAKTMPDMGYSTLSIQPLAMPDGYPSTALEAQTRESENKAVIDDYLQQLQALMTRVIEQAQKQQGAILIVSAGNNAGFLTRLFSESKLPQPQAFIMLSAYQLTPENNQQFARQLSENDIPTLDLFLKHDNQNVAHSMLLRKQESTRNLKVEYRQYQINNFETGYYPNKALLGAIRGWLASLGW
ncbi:DUF3530 family protein [Thalassotalea sp. LPB0316]|uniref:DUF3530 family protein n=1 Tax=Thalassotalea sp. LPB0316 TaxID=2769490 RepID=UPI001866D056|nr:DUF3530 family protein [Thalassotalea sp. LPB0316]QOL26648.1 DUF3530 family protein [Thalassotalea sp. LPB0316]